MRRQFEPGRAVEILFPKYGSGYRIGGKLVLTAAHLLPVAVGSSCQVRAKQHFGAVEATVVWKAEGWDIALIELPEIAPQCDPVVLGQLPEAQAGEKLPFQMYGYPRWGRTQRDAGKTAAGGRQIEGIIYLADRSADDLLVLEAQRLPPEATTERSQWEGVSGAAIVCDGLVIAVQSLHQNPKRPASLEADPLLKVCNDKQWCDLLKQHGILPKLERLVLSPKQSEKSSSLSFHTPVSEPDKSRQVNYQTPYSMTIVQTSSSVTCETGIFRFLIRNFNRIAAIFAHIDNEYDAFMDYISRGQKPVYSFVLKGKGFTDFEFMHIATRGSFFEECLTLLVIDFKQHRDDIRFNVIRANQFEERWGQKVISNYVPSLDEMARAFFQDESYLFGGGGGETSDTWDLGWQADTTPYKGLEFEDTRYVDYSRVLVGLKPSSLKEEKYGVEDLVRSGVLVVDRDLLHYRYRCRCDGWTEEQQDLDFYELGCIFGRHFGYEAIFSPARFLSELARSTIKSTPNATVYVEKGKRIEVLPMEWNLSWFTCYVNGKASNQGWSLLDDDPNPFRLYDMNDFFPGDLEQYKQKKKKPKQ